jgi:hypothetical protein
MQCSAQLFDHLIGEREQLIGHGEVEDELRELIEQVWPELVHKQPLKGPRSC